MRNFYLIDDDNKYEIITVLDHIRRNAMDRTVITDDCDKIETMIQELKPI